jgi:iron(III) transport system ATP-binding protein
MNNALECRDLKKSFGTVEAVRSVSFTLERGQFMALLGPSGCGKTTVLRMIAGLETPDQGEIRLGGREVSSAAVSVPANFRRVGMVFQDYALFPHMTVEQNIAYGLHDHRSGKYERVNEMLELAGLQGLDRRFPHELSGGQQQRVALARALAPRPDLLLLDEPFSNLDVALRTQVREEAQRILQEANVSVILVTHDQEEAMSLASQIGLMQDGTLIQLGSPRGIYEHPVSLWAAQFLGETNRLRGHAQGIAATTILGDIVLDQPHQGPVDVLVRPEHLVLDAPGQGAPAVLKRRMYYGSHQIVWVELPDQSLLKIRCRPDAAWQSGEPVSVHIQGDAIVFPAPRC